MSVVRAIPTACKHPNSYGLGNYMVTWMRHEHPNHPMLPKYRAHGADLHLIGEKG